MATNVMYIRRKIYSEILNYGINRRHRLTHSELEIRKVTCELIVKFLSDMYTCLV